MCDDLMMDKMILVLGLLGFVGVGNAQLTQAGQCETLNTMAGFVLDTFIGAWYELGKSSNNNPDCSTLEFTSVNGVITVSNQSVVNNFAQTATGTATHTTGTAILTLTYASSNPIEFRILNTDYSNYAVAYNCVNLGNTQRSVNVWLLGRQTTSLNTAAILNLANAALEVFGTTVAQLPSVDHSTNACTRLPVIPPGQPIILDGPCSTTIPVIQNFRVADFVGSWHEISSYYSVNAVGTCARAEYTLEGTTVNVLNSQVLDQRLDTISGTATLIGTNGEGRLNVVLDVQGIPIAQELLIIDTDYSGYAVSYSCSNLGNNQRQVNSWILSKTRQISAASQAEVTRVLGTLVDLNSVYYQPTLQTDAACFYYPDPQPGVPVVFRGQCANTIAAVPNFNFAQFAGTWHEIQAYPKENQTGSCVNHVFTTGTAANSLNLVSNEVVEERLSSSSGNVVLESTDGSGRLRLTMTVNGQLISIPYWIVATDYNSYALVYSCENIDEDYRLVHSWKLSKTQTLTQDANAAINAAMAPINVLGNEYYEYIGQSDYECFYYPVFAETPEVIILPGSCPPMFGKANFVPTSYMGHWFDVASYPIPSQNGTCPRAEYSLVDGVITIRNTMVSNQQLQTQMGIARLSSSGTGLLTVTFVLENGEEVVTTYYILETDYTSFSLVYNCRNLADGRRQVTSWKLSRTPTLTANANNIINGIVSSTQGLLEDYYESTSQTAGDCFYVPELQPGQAVLFRGACEAVTPMTGFNVSQYLGWWHEIERYPTDAQPGQCTSADFRQSGNVYQVVETSVDGGNVNETTSNVVISSGGTITITKAEGPTVWHVLATDHNTYSLLYSCETVSTVSGDYRRVWSAKHSKARSLTPAAQAAMNPIIANNNLLHPHLYEQVNQNASACFHYREEAGEQVILPGQCAAGIPVQSGFDASRFAGTWYHLERYPHPQMDNESTCVGTRYTVDGDSLTVLNWEVLDGTLNEVRGTATVNAGSATLSVTLPVPGSEETTTTQLRILLTDYEEYALAYTCVNIDQFRRAVGAFKLSRNRALSNAARSAIENYMATREELHQPYFLAIPHNDECLEPSSALLIQSSVIIMVACIILQLIM